MCFKDNEYDERVEDSLVAKDLNANCGERETPPFQLPVHDFIPKSEQWKMRTARRAKIGNRGDRK
jgi:hypothetical protein